uniref:Uncharacterized protein n=1 Tax=Corvus moneduloides TaxID=1196302 RepID=A0A8U7NIH0_CORMO
MRRGRGAALAALAAVLLVILLFSLAVALAKAQVQQESRLETTEGTGINISCSHPKIQTSEYIYWYCHLPGRGPEFLALIVKESKDGKFSMMVYKNKTAPLEIARVSLQDTAIYYCALRHHLKLSQISSWKLKGELIWASQSSSRTQLGLFYKENSQSCIVSVAHKRFSHPETLTAVHWGSLYCRDLKNTFFCPGKNRKTHQGCPGNLSGFSLSALSFCLENLHRCLVTLTL